MIDPLQISITGELNPQAAADVLVRSWQHLSPSDKEKVKAICLRVLRKELLERVRPSKG